MNNSSHSSQKARRIVSAHSNSSRKGGSQGGRPSKLNVDEEAKEFLPEIHSTKSRGSQRSKVSLAKASSSALKKSYQLGDTAQADQIIEQANIQKRSGRASTM